MDWIDQAQDRDKWWAVVNAVISLRVARNAGNILTSCRIIRISRRALHRKVRLLVGWLKLESCLN